MIKSEDVKGFFEFVYSRQEIWHKRHILKQEPPWTEDEALKKYLFCNVYRELDKGTQYLYRRILVKSFDRPKTFLNVVAYRLFNLPGFFEKQIRCVLDPDDYNFSVLEHHLDNWSKDGNKMFSSAYTICQQQVDKTYRPREKHIQVLFILQYLVNNMEKILFQIDNAKTPRESLNAITELPNVGDFLAYEIWCDLSYTDFFKQGWTDNDFVNIGPGCIWGFQLMTGDKDMGYKGAEEYCIALRDYQHTGFKELYNRIGKDWFQVFWSGGSNDKELSLRNIEHSGCEYRKYLRLIKGEGRKRYYSYPNGATL